MIKNDSNINGYLKIIIIILIIIGCLIYPITKISQYIQDENKETIKYCTLLNGEISKWFWEIDCSLNWFPIGDSTYYMEWKFKLKEYCTKNGWKIINWEFNRWSLTQTLDDVFYCELNWKKIYEIPTK